MAYAVRSTSEGLPLTISSHSYFTLEPITETCSLTEELLNDQAEGGADVNTDLDLEMDTQEQELLHREPSNQYNKTKRFTNRNRVPRYTRPSKLNILTTRFHNEDADTKVVHSKIIDMCEPNCKLYEKSNDIEDDTDNSSDTCTSSDERLTDIVNESEFLSEENKTYPCFNGSFITQRQLTMCCLQSSLDPFNVPWELQRFNISPSEYCEVTDLLRKDPKVTSGACFYHRLLQYIIVILICIFLWTLGSLLWGYTGHKKNIGFGLFFLLSWMTFICFIFMWRIVCQRINIKSKKISMKINKILMKKKILLCVRDFPYISCSCRNMSITFIYFDPEPCLITLTENLQKQNIWQNKRFAAKFKETIKSLTYQFSDNNTESASLMSKSLTQYVYLTREQREVLARYIFLSYSTTYTKWLLQHRLPKPLEKRHTQTNIPCLCQFIERFCFKLPSIIAEDNTT